jgi:hypothetical protein
MTTIRDHIGYDAVRPSRSHPHESDDADGADRWCPHCGGVLGREPALYRHPAFDDIQHTANGFCLQFRVWLMLCALRASFGRYVGRDYLIAWTQPRRGDEADPRTIEVYLSILRKVLAGTNLRIETLWGAGQWRLCAKTDDRGDERRGAKPGRRRIVFAPERLYEIIDGYRHAEPGGAGRYARSQGLSLYLLHRAIEQHAQKTGEQLPPPKKGRRPLRSQDDDDRLVDAYRHAGHGEIGQITRAAGITNATLHRVIRQREGETGEKILPRYR